MIPTPATSLYHERLRQGKGHGCDFIWRAACWEAAGMDAYRDGHLDYAQTCFERANEILSEGGE